jgi:putative ABC transport system permease protein
MRLPALWQLVKLDLVRVRGALVTSGFGIAAGTAALVFFLALGLGVRSVLLGDVFPIDQVELEPPKGTDPGLIGGMLGLGSKQPGISEEEVAALRASPLVAGVYPKLRMRFPASGHGELMGIKLGTPEIVGDGISAELVADELDLGERFDDPIKRPGAKCKVTPELDDCKAPQYCEGPANGQGVCVDPVPVLVSRYLVEFFDKTVAPAHGKPPMGASLIEAAKHAEFRLWLGQSALGRALKSEKAGPRHVRARVVGVSKRAMDIGITLPLEVVQRWNKEYAGEDAAKEYSSVLVLVKDNTQLAEVMALGSTMDLSPKDTKARDVSVLLTGVMALLALVAAIILIVSASNIAYTFRVLVNDRRREIALYRAIGASAGDMFQWMLGLALTVGVCGGAIGVLVAYLGSLGADRLAATRLPDFPFKPHTFFAFPPWLIGGALLFAALFALLGAVGPARRAGRVDPAAALAAL